MYRNNLLLGFILMLIAFTSNGQNQKTSYGISSSMDLNSYVFVNDYGQVQDLLTYKGRLSYSVGFILRHKIFKNTFFKTGIYYSNKSFSETLNMRKYREYNGNDPLLSSSNRDLRSIQSTKFIDIPFDVQFLSKRERKFEFYPIIGLVNSFRIGYTTKGDKYPSDDIGYKSYLLASKVGLGMQMAFKKTCIVIEPQVRFYLNKVHEQLLTENPLYFGFEISLLHVSSARL